MEDKINFGHITGFFIAVGMFELFFSSEYYFYFMAALVSFFVGLYKLRNMKDRSKDE